jgi:hypothetical protein
MLKGIFIIARDWSFIEEPTYSESAQLCSEKCIICGIFIKETVQDFIVALEKFESNEFREILCIPKRAISYYKIFDAPSVLNIPSPGTESEKSGI